MDRRMCGDYRPLHVVTEPINYLMPTPDKIFDAIGKATIFTTLDMRQGFNQIVIEEADRCKTAFWGKNGLWEWITMPFGLRNASLFFQMLVDFELAGLPFVRCYIDDILIFSSSMQEHYQHVKVVLQKLLECGLRAHPKKCKFGYRKISYLRHVIKPGQIEPQEAKVAAIHKMPRPVNVAALRVFLGLINYYRRFFKDMSRTCQPLYSLLKKDVPWGWGQEQEQVWQALKAQLVTQPVLAGPQFDRDFVLYTDWSQTGLGAVLAQLNDEGLERVVAYASRSKNSAEANYSSYKGKCLAAVWGALHF